MSNLRRNRGELIRALIVDDEADIRELLDMTLARMGLECDCAASVAAARNSAGERRGPESLIMASASEQPDEKADDDRHDDRCRQREVEGKSITLDMQVAGQAAQTETGQPRPGDAERDGHDAGDD